MMLPRRDCLSHPASSFFVNAPVDLASLWRSLFIVHTLIVRKGTFWVLTLHFEAL